MNFKRFATYMVALSVIALGVWACSDYAGRSMTPQSSNKLDEQTYFEESFQLDAESALKEKLNGLKKDHFGGVIVV